MGMTASKRNVWPMRLEDGATGIGTATINDGKPRTYRREAKTVGELMREFTSGPRVLAEPKKSPKYRNTKCEHDGIKFDSLKERTHWLKLVERQAAGEIRDLQLQVRFELTPRKQRDDGTWERASFYVADFVYIEVASGKQIVEDVKSPATRKNPAYVQKRKQMLAVHDITIKEI